MPRVLCADWPEHHCRTVSQMRWRGLKNGGLLTRVSEHFDVLITVDKNMRFQQNLKKYAVGVIVLLVYSNDYDTLKPLVPRIREALLTIQPGDLVILKGTAG